MANLYRDVLRVSCLLCRGIAQAGFAELEFLSELRRQIYLQPLEASRLRGA